MKLIDLTENQALLWGGCWVKPDGAIIELIPDPREPVHHADHIMDIPEFMDILDKWADEEERDFDYRESATYLGLKQGWIRVRTHASGSGEFLVEFEVAPNEKQVRALFRYAKQHKNAGRIYVNDTQFDNIGDALRSLT